LSEWQGIRQIKNLDLQNKLNVYSVNGRIDDYREKWVTFLTELRNKERKKERKKSMYRPGQALRFPEG
jgi:hypothetical protein